MRSVGIRFLGAAAAVLVGVGALAADGAAERATIDRGEVALGVGLFNFGHDLPSTGFGAEYRLPAIRTGRLGWKPYALVPTVGISATSRSAVLGYGGLRADVDVTSRWRVTPGFAIVVYDGRDDIDLGGPVQFRSSLDVSRAFDIGLRLGISIYHISNARLYAHNPGVNCLVFVQTF